MNLRNTRLLLASAIVFTGAGLAGCNGGSSSSSTPVRSVAAQQTNDTQSEGQEGESDQTQGGKGEGQGQQQQGQEQEQEQEQQQEIPMEQGGPQEQAGGGGAPSEQQNQVLTGTFNALNASVLPQPISGNVRIETNNGEMTVNLDVSGSQAGLSHLIHIHAGATCPTSANDANNDGIVDVVEEGAPSGKILLPFGTPLEEVSANISDTEGLPADDSGNVTFEASASVSDVEESLRTLEVPADSPFTALGPNETLNLENRVVIVHGVPEDTDLPDTVESILGLPATTTLPIGCAELQPEAGAGAGQQGAGTGGQQGAGTGGQQGTGTGGQQGAGTGGTGAGA